MMAQWRSRMASIPKIPPEDSILLRVLVQSLVIIGIIATDIAAADVTDRLNLIPWAVPSSIAGATISYLRRRKRNIGIKFAIAIGMLIALGYFFVNLLSRSNDTRLVLVELLIQLQVLHSLDLPRRKDLGYSMVIGLILISVSATLSQTLVFGPFLLLFLAIALPVLILDYRSRIGLRPEPGQGGFKALKLSPDLSPKRLFVVLLTVMALGLGAFALLPRLPGYQLRSFPVSAPIDVQGRFDNRQVINPGYITNPNAEGGQGGGEVDPNAVGRGQSPQTGPGEADEEYYYGFNTVMNQNLRGALSPKLVMRVRSQVEGFWRVMAFDRYTGQGWEVSENERTETLRRSPWSYRFLIPTSFFQRRSREVIQTYTMVSDLPNLIPALYEPGELYFPTEEVALDLDGGLRAPVPLSEGTTYTVVSRVPYRDRAALAASGQTYPSTLKRYLDVPPELRPILQAKAAELLTQSASEITSPYEKTLFLTQALKQRYQIRPDLPFFGDGEDLVLAFLNKHQGGYPDHFSTTLTMMLRSIGIPARLTVGFGPGEFNPFTGLYLVSNSDAYALTEAFFPGQGWFMFDPIPGHELYPPSVEDSALFGTIKKFWQWVAGWLPSPLRNGLNAVFGFIGMLLGQTIGRLLGLLSSDLVGLFTGLVILTGLAFAGWLGLGWWRRWQRQRWLAQQPRMEQAYQRMLACFAEQGVVKDAAQTPFEYVEQVQQDCATDPALWAEGITRAYVDWRYGDVEPDLTAVEQQRQRLERYFRQVRRSPALLTSGNEVMSDTQDQDAV
ncbi:MAG: DUF3488 domain-containing protein [Synechococcales cyanobacterium RM1_1_8]|nr:DUF3488 domain-containing protein [Synechococcales cyanobacterium RM1_1_8]